MGKKKNQDQRIQITSQSSSSEEGLEDQDSSSSSGSAQQKIQYIEQKKPEQSTIRFLDQLEDNEIQRVAQYTLKKLTVTSIQSIIQSAIGIMSQVSQQKIVEGVLQKISAETLKRILKNSIKKVPQLALVAISSKKKKQKQLQKQKQKNSNSKQKTKSSKKDQIQKQIRPPKTKISDIQSFQQNLKPQQQHKPETFQQVQQNIYAQQQRQTSQNEGSSSSDQGSDSQRRQSSRPTAGSASYQHFAAFMTTYYKLHSEPARRKQFFMRRQPIFERYVNTVKSDNFKDHSKQLPVINLNTFRKYMKKYHKSFGLKYQQKRNMYRMKIVMGICLKTNNNRYGGGTD